MDCTRLEYIKNVNDDDDDVWAYEFNPIGAYFRLNFKESKESKESKDIKQQRSQRILELFEIARQRYLDAGGNPRRTPSGLKGDDYMTDEERQEALVSEAPMEI